MIAGETLTVSYRFRWRSERCMRAAREIEQDIRRRERPVRDRHALPADDRAPYLGVSPLATRPECAPYR